MYHAACKVEFQPFKRSYSQLTFSTFFIKSWKTQLWVPPFDKNFKNVRCEYDRLNGLNSTLQAAWYIRRVRIICFLWTKPTIWLLVLSFTQNIVRACSMFYPYEGYRRWLPWMLPGSKSWKTSAVSTTVWMVEAQHCKLRGTSDAFV